MITAEDFINKGLIVGNPSAANIAEFNTALAYLQQSATATQLIQASLDNNVNIKLSSVTNNVYHVDASGVEKTINGITSPIPIQNQFPANTIEWKVNTATIYPDGNNPSAGVISPVILLVHEMAHAFAASTSTIGGLTGIGGTAYANTTVANSDPQYGTLAEKSAITNWEHPITTQLGLSSLRFNHNETSQFFGGSTLNFIVDSGGTYHWQQSFDGQNYFEFS